MPANSGSPHVRFFSNSSFSRRDFLSHFPITLLLRTTYGRSGWCLDQCGVRSALPSSIIPTRAFFTGGDTAAPAGKSALFIPRSSTPNKEGLFYVLRLSRVPERSRGQNFTTVL